MKMLLTAVAMMIASPALAQTAPAGGHAAHAGHATPAAQGSAHAGHAGTAGADPHAGHDMSGGMMDCCAKMKADGKKMACCDKPAASAAPAADPHAGHYMNSKN